MKVPWHKTTNQKSTELTTKMMHTIMLIYNIELSNIIVPRKYTNFISFFSHETRNVSLVRSMQICEAK